MINVDDCAKDSKHISKYCSIIRMKELKNPQKCIVSVAGYR